MPLGDVNENFVHEDVYIWQDLEDDGKSTQKFQRKQQNVYKQRFLRWLFFSVSHTYHRYKQFTQKIAVLLLYVEVTQNVFFFHFSTFGIL